MHVCINVHDYVYIYSCVYTCLSVHTPMFVLYEHMCLCVLECPLCVRGGPVSIYVSMSADMTSSYPAHAPSCWLLILSDPQQVCAPKIPKAAGPAQKLELAWMELGFMKMGTPVPHRLTRGQAHPPPGPRGALLGASRAGLKGALTAGVYVQTHNLQFLGKYLPHPRTASLSTPH